MSCPGPCLHQHQHVCTTHDSCCVADLRLIRSQLIVVSYISVFFVGCEALLTYKLTIYVELRRQCAPRLMPAAPLLRCFAQVPPDPAAHPRRLVLEFLYSLSDDDACLRLLSLARLPSLAVFGEITAATILCSLPDYEFLNRSVSHQVWIVGLIADVMLFLTSALCPVRKGECKGRRPSAAGAP